MTELLPISFEFVLREAGWAELTVRLGDAECHIGRISYLTNALDDLLIAGLHLSFGYHREKVTFDNEGWLTDLRFDTVWINRAEDHCADGIYADPRVRISVVELEDGEEDKLLLTGLCETNDVVANALFEMGDKVWSEHGADGYDRCWISGGFPNRALEALRTALAIKPAPGRADDY